MSACRLSVAGICLLASVLLFGSVPNIAQQNDGVFLVYARSARSDVKLIRFITEFPGEFPASLMREMDVSMVLVRTGDKSKVAASRPALPQITLDSIVEWLVPFNPMSADTFAIAMRIVPLRKAISDKSKLLASSSSRLVSLMPWFRKGISPQDTAGGRPRPGVNNFKSVYTEPDFNIDTLGSYIFYPPQARGRGLKGKVQVAALVDVDGFVDDLVIVKSSHDVFDIAAARAVRCLRFTPGLVGSTPTAMWVTIPIEFSSE